MTDRRSSEIEAMRSRYLRRYRNTHKRDERLALFEEIRGMAASAEAPAWTKFAEGMTASVRGDWGAALELFEAAIVLDPVLAYPWNGKGNVLQDLKRYEEALAAYQEAMVLDPSFAYPWNGKGNVLQNLKRYEEALAACKRAIALDPAYADPWNGTGRALSSLTRHEEALAAFEKAITLDPEFAYAWSGKGHVLSDRKRHLEALAAFEKAITLDPEFAYAWSGKGHVLSDRKRHLEALAAFEKAITLDPESAYAWNGMGLVLDDLERYEDALAAYDKATALDPKDASAWNNKGVALVNANRYDEALAAYDKAIALDPKDAGAWSNKGVTLDNVKRYDEALAAYDKAITLDPRNSSALSNKGVTLRGQGRYDEALAASQAATEADPANATSQYALGLVYWDLRKYRQASEAFRHAIELGLEPSQEEAARAWAIRAALMMGPGSPEELDQRDRSSGDALVAVLHEKLSRHMPTIRRRKAEFDSHIAESIGREPIIGSGAVDDMLLVLRDWNSYSPILRRELRSQSGPGPVERLGGGYFLVWRGYGIVIDPGVDFVTQLYRKGLSIADINAVVITHCHLDHTRDVESLVDLNYRYNQARKAKLHPDSEEFRPLEFFLCHTAFMKYGEYLTSSGCCLTPRLLERDGDAKRIEHTEIEVLAVKAHHRDINGRNNEAVGLVFALKDKGGRVVRVGFTSDTKWHDLLSKSFVNCDVLVAHLGTVEVEEDKAAADVGPGVGKRAFVDRYLENHLGMKGCHRLLHDVRPKIFVLGEFGEELVESRLTIVQILHGLKPKETRLVLGGDSNLAIGLEEGFSVLCSHPECLRSWARISLDQVHPVLGDNFLFEYICSAHSLIQTPLA